MLIDENRNNVYEWNFPRQLQLYLGNDAYVVSYSIVKVLVHIAT